MATRLSVCTLLLLCILQRSSCQSLSYALTVRDFLPQQCSKLRSNADFDVDFSFNNGIDSRCPYQADLAAGTISGHPDFDRSANALSIPNYFRSEHFVNGNEGYIISGSGGNADHEKTVEEYTEIAPSGIPKPVYCTGNTLAGFNGTLRCGLFKRNNGNFAFATTNKTFFDMWFNDNIRYNRRVGVPLDLKPGSEPFEFLYENTDPENIFNPTPTGFYAPHNHLKFTEAAFPDPFTVPNWPKENILRSCYSSDTEAGNKRLWHTTEIHTFFEYRKSEVFSFTGDDDVWVYLNGVLAVDVGGVHAARSQVIDLSRDAAAERFNMTVGGIYTFDMFQAERKCRDSNFAITTSLSAPCNAANEANSKLQFDSTTDLSEEKVKIRRGVTLNGDGSFILTNSGLPHSTSYLWVREPVNVGTGFVIEFDFTITDLTEGFAFVLQRRPEGLTNLPISGGANLGFKGLSNSLAIVFDLCQDRAEPGTSCDEQRLSIHLPEQQGAGNNPSNRTLRVQDSVMLSLKNNEKHTVKLDYFFIPPALEVTLDGSLYLRELPFDAIEAFQSRGAFAGFTATTGEFDQSVVTISDFRIFAVDVEASTTQTVDFPVNLGQSFTRKFILADGIETDGFTIQTRDGCESLIEFGGRTENTRGIFVEKPNNITGLYFNGSTTPRIIDATIEDDNSGKYKYLLSTLEEGSYSFYLFYGNAGDSCAFNFSSTFVNVDGSIVEVLTVQLDSGSSSSCFFAEIEDAVEMLPLTAAPTVGPTPLGTIEQEVDDTATLVASVGGGVVGACIAIAAFLAVVYRRRWQKDKMYIEEGKRYKLDANTKFDPNDKLGVAGRELLASRAAILRLRAQRGQEMAALTKLENEQEDLMEQIAALKKSVELKGSDRGMGEAIAAPTRRPPKKLEF